MFFKKKNDNNIDNNDKNAIDIESAESNNNNNKKEKRKFKDSINKKYLKNGSYSSVMIVVFVAIIIVINMIAGNLPSKYTQLDISSEKLYTIGDETKAMLKNLDKDVTIYQIAQSGSEDETISNLLQRFWLLDMLMNLIILRWNRKIQWSILNLSVNTPVTTFPLIA